MTVDPSRAEGANDTGGDEAIEVSVVIPALNAAHCIGDQLTALARQDVPFAWEVVVADNGSTDGTADAVRAFADRLPVRVADASARRGHTPARNAGAAAARGRKLLYCDADDEVGPGWVVAMAAELDRSDLVGGYVDDASLNDADSQQWRRTQDQQGLPTKMGFLPLAISANFGIRADVLKAIGGFNGDYGEGCNDVEVCWRGEVKGYTLGYVPEAVVKYRYRTTVKGLGRQMYARGRAEPQLYGDFRPYGVPRRRARDTTELRDGGRTPSRRRARQGPTRPLRQTGLPARGPHPRQYRAPHLLRVTRRARLPL